MTRLDEIEPIPSGPASQGPVRPSIWSAIHPKLLELVRAHRSTLIFVNSRRLAERISGAVNELAGEILVRAHHGSVAAAQRKEIEERLKTGNAARHRRDFVARTRHRHGRDRSGGADRSAAFGGERDAAHRARQPSRGRRQLGGHLSEVSRRSGGLRRDHARDVRRQGGARQLSAQSAGRAGAADRGDGGDGRVGRRTSCSASIRRAAPYRGAAAVDRSKACSTCCRGAIPRTNSSELRPRITWDRVSGQDHGARRARSESRS